MLLANSGIGKAWGRIANQAETAASVKFTVDPDAGSSDPWTKVRRATPAEAALWIEKFPSMTDAARTLALQRARRQNQVSKAAAESRRLSNVSMISGTSSASSANRKRRWSELWADGAEAIARGGLANDPLASDFESLRARYVSESSMVRSLKQKLARYAPGEPAEATIEARVADATSEFGVRTENAKAAAADLRARIKRRRVQISEREEEIAARKRMVSESLPTVTASVEALTCRKNELDAEAAQVTAEAAETNAALAELDSVIAGAATSPASPQNLAKMGPASEADKAKLAELADQMTILESLQATLAARTPRKTAATSDSKTFQTLQSTLENGRAALAAVQADCAAVDAACSAFRAAVAIYVTRLADDGPPEATALAILKSAGGSMMLDSLKSELASALARPDLPAGELNTAVIQTIYSLGSTGLIETDRSTPEATVFSLV